MRKNTRQANTNRKKTINNTTKKEGRFNSLNVAPKERKRLRKSTKKPKTTKKKPLTTQQKRKRGLIH
jgi:hypothetical protein